MNLMDLNSAQALRYIINHNINKIIISLIFILGEKRINSMLFIQPDILLEVIIINLE